ncbi:hypothetical protein [Paenibacillus sp. Marseille-Q7038]
MSKRSESIVLSILAFLILSGLIISEINSRTSFKELVIDQIGDSHGSQEIFSIYITEGEGILHNTSIEITDLETINKVMNVFAELKLKRTNSENPIFQDKYYRVRIQPDNGPTLSVIFADDKIMNISSSFNSKKKHHWTYEAVGGFDISTIQAMLK